MPAVAAGAEHDQGPAGCGLAEESAKRARRVDDLWHPRERAAPREVDQPAGPCDDPSVVSRHQRDRPKARGAYPEPSSFLRGRGPPLAPMEHPREFSTGALKFTRLWSDAYDAPTNCGLHPTETAHGSTPRPSREGPRVTRRTRLGVCERLCPVVRIPGVGSARDVGLVSRIPRDMTTRSDADRRDAWGYRLAQGH